jgi:phosphoglycolate phosphatase-like HAD superfamily hydrolase
LAFVGDEEKDIQTAKNVGAVSIFINRNGDDRSMAEDIQISSLYALSVLYDRSGAYG